MVAFFFESQFPGGVGSQAGGAANMVLVVPVNLDLQQRVGVFVVGDFFVSQKGDQPILEGAKATFDFAFGRRIGSDAMSHTQRGESALELRVSVEPVGGGSVAKESQPIGVEAGGRAVFFNDRAKVSKVRPSRVAGGEGAAQDFAGVIVEGKNEAGIVLGGPPGMGRTVVLPEFADGGALPAATGFGAAFGCGDQVGKVLPDIGGDGGAGAMEAKLTGQFIDQQGEVEWLAIRQKSGQKIVGGLRPARFVIATGGCGRESGLVTEPLMAKPVELGRTDVQTLCGREGVELAGVEGGQNFLDVESRNTMDELFFFMEGEDRVLPPSPESFSHWTLVEKDSTRQQNGLGQHRGRS